MIPIDQDFRDYSIFGAYKDFVKKLQRVGISAGCVKWGYSIVKGKGTLLWLTLEFKDEMGFGKAGKIEWHFNAFTAKHECFFYAYSWSGNSSKAYARHFQNHLTKHGIKSRHTKFRDTEGVAIDLDIVYNFKEG